MAKDNAGRDTGHRAGRDSPGKVASNKYFYPIYGIILLIILFIIYIILQTPEGPVEMIRRFAGTFGYLSIFLAILTTEYMVKIKKYQDFLL